ncbi:TIGR02646 family protein [Sphingobium sp. AP50]|uniref:endonuclease n=1 Tax=Sphingobium sp. AP50 TaxID=1884369 RepID=UPI0008C5A7AD|nr:endonuclease [Sphingobium sp. AP50]SEK04693.1 TIGR02646 family protein [Sphingobium sp. AP50]
MRYVDRTSVAAPDSLTSSSGIGIREHGRLKNYHDDTVPGPLDQHGVAQPKKKPSFRAYKEDDVRHALEDLFHGKCAYCETRYDLTAPVDVEHFRPKGAVEGEEHSGYWWLAATWWNLLPSCIDCNRRREQETPDCLPSLLALLNDERATRLSTMKSGKGACFPIEGVRVEQLPEGDMLGPHAAEEAMLIDPCAEDPRAHLRFMIDRRNPLGIVFPFSDVADEDGIALPLLSEDVEAVKAAAHAAGASVKGAVSIQMFGLNRLALVQERTRILRRLEILGHSVRDLSVTADRLSSLSVHGEAQHVIDDAVLKLRSTVSRLLSDVRAMAAPKSPFSELARAWIQAFTQDLAQEAVELPDEQATTAANDEEGPAAQATG